MRGIYLAACKARHPDYDIIYQDIDPKYKCDLGGNMMDIDLEGFDYIIASPPCNWWSRANPYYKTSKYALNTKYLLPSILDKLGSRDKPFIVENVRNDKRFTEQGIYDICKRHNINIYKVGRHTYFTNIECDLNCPQIQDFKYGGKRVNNDGYNQGGTNVHNVLELWLKEITRGE